MSQLPTNLAHTHSHNSIVLGRLFNLSQSAPLSATERPIFRPFLSRGTDPFPHIHQIANHHPEPPPILKIASRKSRRCARSWRSAGTTSPVILVA